MPEAQDSDIAKNEISQGMHWSPRLSGQYNNAGNDEKRDVVMDWGSFILLAGSFTIIMLMVQRAERRRRRLVGLFMLVIGILIQRYAVFWKLYDEALFGFIVALILNFLFWALIGRYNPVGTSDDIRVMGLDD
ncbi:MAG: hypothetical protein H6672_09550 [Anaerolineaceae bacterium]|nr:hypothetical protein [Anaerolineaceae bacterium]